LPHAARALFHEWIESGGEYSMSVTGAARFFAFAVQDMQKAFISVKYQHKNVHKHEEVDAVHGSCGPHASAD